MSARRTASHAAIRPGARSRRCHRAACGSSSATASVAHVSRRRGSRAEPLVHAFWMAAKRMEMHLGSRLPLLSLSIKLVCVKMHLEISSDAVAVSVSRMVGHRKFRSDPLTMDDVRWSLYAEIRVLQT